ncbi:MAG: transcriptional regulator [Betaproteobacteria bacterium]
MTIDKTFKERKPLTSVKLTKTGRNAFVKYLDSIAKLVR